ncbi:DUF2529 family protein [Peribacillus frigoritolerans]|nr:DUF2529 family protein [Peribacillus frigoritolerans]
MIENEAFEMEDAGRLLAQAVVGDGSVFIHGFGEMQGVTAEALNGAEPFPKAKSYELSGTISREDRFLIFSRHSDDSEALMLAKQLKEKRYPICCGFNIRPFRRRFSFGVG